jgi:N-acetylglucosamine-6-phosphate deacetylase
MLIRATMHDLQRPTVIGGGDVMLPDGLARGAAVLIRHGRIAALLPRAQTPPPDAETIEARGLTVLPGFIDIHCHGGGGATFDAPSPEGISTVLATHARAGTTAMLAALPALAPDDRHAALRTLREYCRTNPPGPELLGAYLEGPYFSPTERGAQPESLIRPPTPDDYEPTLQEFSDFIRVWSLAPELQGAPILIRRLASCAIVTALGHSDASHEHVLAAIDAGASLVTHVYCAHSSFHRHVAEKKLGLAEMALLRDELTVELIPDGKHLPPLLLQLVLKNKRPERACVITDAMPAAGLPPGTYDFLGTDIRVTPQVAYRPDGRRYAGSILTMGKALRNMILLGGVTLADASKMLSETPAALLGINHRKGSIQEGKDADLVLIDPSLRVRHVLCRGCLVSTDASLPLA